MAQLPKKYKYRLQPLLTVKEKHKRKMEIELAQSISQEKKERERLVSLEKEKEEMVEKKLKARRDMGKFVSSGESRIYDSGLHLNYLEKLQEDVEEKDREILSQHRIIDDAVEVVKKSKRNFIDAVKELKAMEKHKELWIKQIQKVLNAKEQKELNELGNVIHQIRKMG